MRRTQFSDERIIGLLKEAEAGAVVTDLWRRHGMSSATVYAWEARFGGMEGEPLSAIGPRAMASDAKRLRALEDENGTLKRLLADAMLDSEADRMTVRGTVIPLSRVEGSAGKRMVTPAAKRNAVRHLRTTLGMSERRACAVVGADRTSMRYRSCWADDAGLRARLRELAGERRRFGDRRLHILLRRDGLTLNRKKTQWLYREEDLTVRRRKT